MENQIAALILYFFLTYSLAVNKTSLGETECLSHS